MRVFVQLADIFDLNPSVMKGRMNYAGKNGIEDYWERFFPCDDIHKGVQIVYLFTEYQLKELSDDWNNLGVGSPDVVKKEKDYARQKVFRDPLKDGRLKDRGLKDRVRACYIKINSAYQPELIRVYFGAIPQANKVDFFKTEFAGVKSSASTDAERREEIMQLLALRPKIEEYFKGPGKKDKKWLRYLSQRLKNFDHKSVEYCCTGTIPKYPGCPFLNASCFP